MVVAVVDSSAASRSSRSLSEARAYLRSLHVPLEIWTPIARRKLPDEWADAGLVHVDTPDRLIDAAQGLRQTLDRQRIVWLEGTYLPQEIVLTSRAPEGVTFAGWE